MVKSKLLRFVAAAIFFVVLFLLLAPTAVCSGNEAELLGEGFWVWTLL